MFEILKKMFGNSTTDSLATKLTESPFLVDVRSKQEFNSGTCQGAVNIPLDQIQSQLSKFKDKKNIVVFCRSGMRSSQAKAILERNGISNVTNGGTWEKVSRLLNQ
jgi:rhodanese-related sulfurtransferase